MTHAIGDGRRVARQALIALGEALEPLTRPDRADAVRLFALAMRNHSYPP